MIRIQQIKIEPNQPSEVLEKKILSALRIKKEQLKEWKIVKCSIDARKKPLIKLVYSVDVQVEKEKEASETATAGATAAAKKEPRPRTKKTADTADAATPVAVAETEAEAVLENAAE